MSNTGWNRFPVAQHPPEHACPFTAGELRAMAAVLDVRMPGHKIAAKLHAHADLHTAETPAQP